MMSNFYQNVCFSSPYIDTWSEDTLKLPPSTSLLESCCQEMERKGLSLFPHYQNFPAVRHKNQTSDLCLESWNHSCSKNMSIIPQPLPISCGGQFTIKPGVARGSTERDQSVFHYKEGSDSNQGNSRTHPVSLVPGTVKSKSVANQELAEPDQEQSTSSPEEFNGSPM